MRQLLKWLYLELAQAWRFRRSAPYLLAEARRSGLIVKRSGERLAILAPGHFTAEQKQLTDKMLAMESYIIKALRCDRKLKTA